MKILILEDEPRAANQLENALKACGFTYDLLGIIDSVEEACNWFEENAHPDLVFMDIQLADGLSFEVFQNVELQSPIIFTTAFDQYAIKAFKVNSVDYLLKPIKEQDLALALQKFSRQTVAPTLPSDSIQQLLKALQSESKETSRDSVLVKDKGGFVRLNVTEIDYLYSSDSITFAIVEGNRHIIDETLDHFLATLQPDLFFQINRGQVVRKEAILRMEPYLNHRLKLIVTGSRDQDFIVSRGRATTFKAWMNK